MKTPFRICQKRGKLIAAVEGRAVCLFFGNLYAAAKVQSKLSYLQQRKEVECTVFQSIYREGFHGFSIGRVKRDRDFSQNLGYLKNEYQIQYILEGERYFFTSGAKCYKMTGGSIALIDKDQIAKTCLIGGKYHDRILIEIEEADFAPICSGFGLDLKALFRDCHGVFQIKEHEEMQRIFQQMEQIMLASDYADKEMILKMLVTSLLVYGCRLDDYREKTFLSSGYVQGSLEKQKRVCEIVEYIGEHYMEGVGLDELSRRFFMSKPYMCRIFKEVTSFSVSEYINMVRIAQSKEYLVNSEISLTEIANRLGFNSLTYFERVFKREMFLTPMQYRKRKSHAEQELKTPGHAEEAEDLKDE